MNRIVRLAVYTLLLVLGLSATPATLYNESLVIAVIGFACVVLVQVRTTRNAVDQGLAWTALWAVAAVLGAPFIPVFHLIGDLTVGGL